jgi:hypothetical protein
MAITLKTGRVFLMDTRQQWSEQFKKPITVMTLSERLSQSDYNTRHPNKKTKAEYKKDLVMETFKEIEILQYLVEILQEGEND